MKNMSMLSKGLHVNVNPEPEEPGLPALNTWDPVADPVTLTPWMQLPTYQLSVSRQPVPAQAHASLLTEEQQIVLRSAEPPQPITMWTPIAPGVSPEIED